MQNYRNYPPQASQQRSPHAGRRGPLAAPHPPPPPQQQQHPAHNQLAQQQAQQQQLDQIRRADAARRQAKKPTDRDIPDEISEVIVGDGVQRYKRLREIERRLDATMMRKRLDINDNVQRRCTRREGILRIWISNTVEGQPWQLMEDGTGADDGMFDLGENQATFRVKIEGRLLEDPNEAEEDKPPASQRPRLSSFFKAIKIDFDRAPILQPDGYSGIEWRKPQPGPQNVDLNAPESSFDTLEFTRKSDEEMNITISLTRDEKNERYKLSPELAELLDTEEEDKAGAVQGIWDYCRALNLQEDEDKRRIRCDPLLQRLFKRDQIYVPYLPDLISQHLLPLPPIQLQYTIRVDKAYITGTPSPDSPSDGSDDKSNHKPSRPTIYDVRVPLPNPLAHLLNRFHTSKAHIGDLQTIVRIDDELALLVQKIHRTNAKRKFYENLAKDPASFLRRWTSSQQRDLEIILAEATRGAGIAEDGAMVNEEFRRGGADGIWNSDLAKESVALWLARNQKAH